MHDGGAAADSSHYFSRNTKMLANSYEDVGWMRLAVQSVTALVLMLAVFLPFAGGFGTVALFFGAGLALVTAYVSTAKLIGTAARH